MGCFTRIHKLGNIPIVSENGHQIDSFIVAGRMMLPLSIEKPIDGGVQRYYLSISLGELAYLHENIPIS